MGFFRDLFGGGGNPSSRISYVDNQLIVNTNKVETFAEQLNEVSATVVVNIANKCGVIALQTNSIELSDIESEFGLIIGEIDQSQISSLDFKCTQNQETKTTVSVEMSNNFINEIYNNNKASILALLEANAKANIERGGFLSPGGGGGTNVSVERRYEIINENYSNFELIVQNVVFYGVDLNAIQTCESTLNQVNALKVARVKITGAPIYIGRIKQNQVANILAQCDQTQNMTIEIINSIYNNLGVKVVSTSELEEELVDRIGADLEYISRGPLESFGRGASEMFMGLGAGIGAIFSSIGDLFSGLLGGWGGSISSSISLVIIIIACLVGFFYFTNKKGGYPISFKGPSMPSLPSVPNVPSFPT